MISSNKVSIVTRLLKRFNLRYPTLFAILGVITLIDILIPDPIPFIDEIALALLTLLLGTWKNRKTTNYQDGAPPL